MISTDNLYRSHIYLLYFAQNDTKTCHSTAETLIFMTVQNHVYTLVRVKRGNGMAEAEKKVKRGKKMVKRGTR